MKSENLPRTNYYKLGKKGFKVPLFLENIWEFSSSSMIKLLIWCLILCVCVCVWNFKEHKKPLINLKFAYKLHFPTIWAIFFNSTHSPVSGTGEFAVLHWMAGVQRSVLDMHLWSHCYVGPESNFRTTLKINSPEPCNSECFEIFHNRSSLINIFGKLYILCYLFEGSQCESNCKGSTKSYGINIKAVLL